MKKILLAFDSNHFSAGAFEFARRLNEIEPILLVGFFLPAVYYAVPEKFDFPQSNILAYDGSEASIYAIKQFKYLFPELCRQKTLLLYINQKPNSEFPDLLYMEEFITASFNDLKIHTLDINPRKYFATWISEKRVQYS